jgi:ABC-type transport system involved in multi-copper enzyme maturation permease subunit
MAHPIIQRELLGTLRTRRVAVLLACAPVLFSFLVFSRWPSNATVDLSGAQAQEVYRLFAYGLTAVVLLLVPAIPAASIVHEKRRGTMALLLGSPMSSWSIYFGKEMGMLILVSLLLATSLPAAAAAYAMGGISILTQILPLYGLLLIMLLQYTTLALLVSSHANSVDAAVRITYAAVLLMAVGTLGPHYFLQGQAGTYPTIAAIVRCVSPIPALMEMVGHGDVGSFGMGIRSGTVSTFVSFAFASTTAFAFLTVTRLNSFILDRPRAVFAAVDDRSDFQQRLRRLLFVVDPHRRKSSIGSFANPVMVKEFRTRRFGRFHWLLRLTSVAALTSLLLTYAATTGTIGWGVKTIGAIMVVLQVALVVIVTPSLAANLISAERESGGWDLLRMTPLSAVSILVGKLASVLLTLALILFATLPGYLVMIAIRPGLRWQVGQVLVCLAWMALLSVLLSAAVSSLCRRTAQATSISYALLGTICVGTMLFWIGRDTTFGHSTVESVLKLNPMAAALTIIEAPGFTTFNLVPDAWWWTGGMCAVCAGIVLIQTWRLTRPL